jgi:hypothetical protein
VNIGKFI